jgi:hypothetical protein
MPIPVGPESKLLSFGAERQSSFGYLRLQKWTNPIVSDDNLILNDQASSASLVTTVSAFLAQPDFARNIIITPAGTTASVKAANIVITGTNIRGEVITESILMTENGTSPVAGVKAFKTVTGISIPAQDGSGATFDFGVGDVLGLDRCMAGDEVLALTADGVYEATRPTVVYDADEVEKNTINPNASLNGAVDFVVTFVSVEKTYKHGSSA